MTISLPPEIECRLKDEASRHGLSAADLATRIIDKALPKPDQATIDLLNQWDAEEKASDSAEVEENRKEAEQFMQSLNESRIETHGPQARKLWP